MVKKVLLGLGARRLAEAAGNAASAAYGTLSGLSKAAGAIRSATQGAADASKEKTQEAPTNVVYVNFGMAGSAGKQKISGGGTLPARSNMAKPQVSEKMPTEALLDTAVKYLESIDKSLKNQLEFEKRSYEQQVRDEREAIVESKPTFSFSDIKDKFSNLKSNVSEGTRLSGKLAKYALGLGALAAVVASSIDQEQLDALKQNVDEFKKSFGWLGEIGAAVGAGGLLGFLFGGRGVVGRLKGGLVGMVSSHVVSRLYPLLFGGESGTIDPETGEVIPGTEPVRESRSMSALEIGMSLGAGAFAVGYGIKKFRQVRAAGTRMSSLRTAARSGTASQAMASVRKGNSWLASKRGRKFVALVAKKLGQKLFSKIARTLGRIAAMLLLGATGVGAIPAIIGIIASVGFLLFDLYDIATAIWDAWNESKEEDTATAAVPAVARADATAVGGTGMTSLSANRVVSKSETGRPEQALAFFESKGWTREQAAGIVGNLAVESGLRTDAVGDGGQAYGIAQWHPARQTKFKQVYGKDIRNSSFTEQLEYVNWELNNTEKAAGDALRRATTAEDAAAIVDKKYERSAGLHLAERQSNAAAIMAGDFSKVSTGGANGYSGSGGVTSSMGQIANAGLSQVGQLLGAVGSTIIKPGIARSFEPSTSNVSSQINSESMKLQADLTLGAKKEKAKDVITAPTMPGVNPGIPGPIKSISSMDPNYSNMDVLSQYLGHFKKAA